MHFIGHLHKLHHLFSNTIKIHLSLHFTNKQVSQLQSNTRETMTLF